MTMVLIWVLIGTCAVACVAIGSVTYILSAEKKIRLQTEAKYEDTVEKNKKKTEGLESRISELEGDLASEQSENQDRASLIELVAQCTKDQQGRVGVYAFDKTSGEQIPLGAADKALTDLITDNNFVPLYEKLCELRDTEGVLSVDEKNFALTYAEKGNTEVFAITDITDNCRIEEVLGAWKALDIRIEECDIFTVAMDYGAFLKQQTEALAAEGAVEKTWLMLLQTEPTVVPDEIMGGFDEAYTKLCAELLTERFGGKNVTRRASDTFCCIFTAEDEDGAKQTAQEMLDEIDARRKELWPIDERLINRNVLELSKYDGSDLEQFIFCISTRAKVDLQRENSGVIMFDAADVSRISGYKNAIETVIEKRQVRFLYQPIAYSSNAKIFGYEMIPFFPTLPFPNIEEMLRRARLFSQTNRLEELICSESLRLFAKAVDGMKMLSSTRILLKSLNGACMVNKLEEEFHEKNYDLLPNFITELTEELPDAKVVAGIKRSNIARWGAWCAVRVDDDMEAAGMKVGVYAPEVVRISAKVIADKTKMVAVKELIDRLHEDGYQVMADEITKSAEVEAAINIGADYLQGDYVSKATEEPGEISEKCMSKIGQIRFGKRG